MKTNRIKELRTRKGISQEELAETSGLTLRTIQRIENGETEPLGDSLKKIAHALGTTPEELIEWALEENLSFIKSMNLSSLFFLLFPLLGVLVPYILWNSKRGRIVMLDEVGRGLMNFQLTWNILLFICFIGSIAALTFIESPSFALILGSSALILLIAYTYNVFMILFNTSLIQKSKTTRYWPSIRFL